MVADPGQGWKSFSEMKIPSNTLCLGTSSLGDLEPFQARSLLAQAHHLGIREVDTAPLYSKAEEYIGEFLGDSNFNLEVNTKFGLPKPSLINADYIHQTLYASLKRLKVKQISTYFIHSIPMVLITDPILEFLKLLKKEGLVKRIGYSGDNQDLVAAIKTGIFDDFMVTINAIDLTNLAYVQELNSKNQIYIKRPLANVVWEKWFSKQLQHSIFKLLGAQRAKDTQNYRYRFSKLKKDWPFSDGDYLRLFLNFIRNLPFDKKVVVGTTNPLHLGEISEIWNESIPQDFDAYCAEILRIWESNLSLDWKALR